MGKYLILAAVMGIASLSYGRAKNRRAFTIFGWLIFAVIVGFALSLWFGLVPAM